MQILPRQITISGAHDCVRGSWRSASQGGCVIEDPAPSDVSRLRTFLGLANYYHRFVKNFSLIAKPLTILTKKDQPWTWEPEREQAFATLKLKLGSAPGLRRPDATKPFQLHTNWSAVSLGAVLTQKDTEGWEYVIAFASRSNTTTLSVTTHPMRRGFGSGLGHSPF